MGNVFKFVTPEGEEKDLNMTETVIDDSAGTATSSKRTYSGSKIEAKITELNNKISTAESSAKNLANATGVLAVANGGTGATTAKGAQHNLLSDMNEVDSDFTDTDKIVVTYGTSSSSTGSVFKRSALRLWNYIKGKIQATALTLAGAINFTGTVKKNNVDLATTSDLATVQNSIKTTKVDNAVHADNADYADDAWYADNAERSRFLGESFSPHIGTIMTAVVNATSTRFYYIENVGGTEKTGNVVWGTSGNARTLSSPDIGIIVAVNTNVFYVAKGETINVGLAQTTPISGTIIAVLI